MPLMRLMVSERIYDDPRWLPLTKKVYKRYGRKCMATKMTEAQGITLSVDHIKSVSKYPHLAFTFSNLQILAVPVNSMKSNKTEIDYRPLSTRLKYKMFKVIGIILQIFATAFFLTLLYKDVTAGPIETTFSAQILIETWEAIDSL